MIETLLTYGVQYAGYVLELALFGFVLRRGRWRRATGVCLYVVLLLASDGVGRPFFLYRYGIKSYQYTYFYWLTDVLLTLSAFLLICAFFRRACAQQEKLWSTLRLLLTLVFLLVLGISCVSLSRNYRHLFSHFIVEFQQNLYFACAVLNTLLYVMMQQIDCADDELGFLVCGLGIQYAGPAAGLALVYVTHLGQYSSSLFTYLSPICADGMVAVWLYGVTRAPKSATVRASENRRKAPLLAEVAVRGLE